MSLKEGKGLIEKFVQTLEGLERVNDHFSREDRTREAEKEIRAVFYSPEGHLLSDRTVETNMECFCARYMAIVAQADNNPTWQTKREQVQVGERSYATATRREMRKAPRTIQKTIQETVGNPLFQIAFQRDELDTAESIVDPNELSDRRLEILGLQQKAKSGKKPRMSRLEKLQKMISFIPVVNNGFRALEPLCFEHEQNPVALNYFRLSRNAQGYVVGTQHVGENSAEEDDLILFGTDLYGARRRIVHIREGYDKEREILAEIIAVALEVARKIDTDWPDAKTEIPQYREKLLMLVDKLKYVKNEHKVEMRRRIKASVDIKYVRTIPAKFGWNEDGTRSEVRPSRTITVYNPKAAISSLRSLPGLAGKRKKEMTDISGCLGNDEARVNDYIISQESLFGGFYRGVKTQQSKYGILNVDTELSIKDFAKIRGNLSALASQCDPNSKVTYMKPFFEPHLAFAEKMHGHLNDAAEHITTDRMEAARDFTKAYLIAKIQKFYIELERFYRDVLEVAIKSDDVDFDKLSEEINRLGGLIGRKDVYIYKTGQDGKKVSELIETPEYDKVYGGMYHLLNSIRKRVREAQSLITHTNQKSLPGIDAEELSDEQRTKLVRGKLLEMKNRIKKMRFEDLIRRGQEEESVIVTDSAEQIPDLAKAQPPEEEPLQEQA